MPGLRCERYFRTQTTPYLRSFSHFRVLALQNRDREKRGVLYACRNSPIIFRSRPWPLLLRRVVVLPVVVMLRIAGGGRCGGSDARLSVALIALSTAAIVLGLEGLQTHSVEGVQLLTVELFAKPGTSVAEPDLHSRFRQFCSVKEGGHPRLCYYQDKREQ